MPEEFSCENCNLWQWQVKATEAASRAVSGDSYNGKQLKLGADCSNPTLGFQSLVLDELKGKLLQMLCSSTPCEKTLTPPLKKKEKHKQQKMFVS